jgi:hypothetical protein
MMKGKRLVSIGTALVLAGCATTGGSGGGGGDGKRQLTLDGVTLVGLPDND